MFSPRTIAILQALSVTSIWSLSWVFIKFGLQDIPALLFAGLRYTIAAGCLVLLVLSRPQSREQIAALTRRQWLFLALLGLILYAVAQGAQFAALVHLPAVTLSLMLNFTVILVALSGLLIDEAPDRLQWLGIGLFLVGAVIYFGPQAAPALAGLMIGAVCVSGNAVASIMGRSVNRTGHLSPLIITTVSMSIGSLILLATGFVLEGMPPLQPTSWLIISWLAVVHTAFTFTLWNRTLRQLQAFESSLINNTMMIQIAILAWLFLGEQITPLDGLGLLIAVLGIVTVQLGQRRVRQLAR